MEFKPVVVRKNEDGTYPPYQPALEVPKKYKQIVLEWDLENHVAIVSLNRPEKFNALSVTLMKETIDALNLAEAEDKILAIIMRGSSENFCAGGDVSEFAGKELLTQRWFFDRPVEVLLKMMSITKPIIGVIRGWCAAFGFSLGLTCDIVVASENAQFLLPGGKVGFGCFTPFLGGYKSSHSKRIFELLLTSRPKPAQWAFEAGMVNYVLPDEEVDKKAWEIATTIGSNAPIAVKWLKQFFYTVQDMEHNKAFRYGTEMMVLNSLTKDGHEGHAAFLEKRKPVWMGKEGGGVRGDVFSPEDEHTYFIGDELKKE